MSQNAIKWGQVLLQALVICFLGSQNLRGFHMSEDTEQLNNLDAIGSIGWVKAKVEAYPELSWLLSEEVEHTQEGTPSQQENSWSIKLKGTLYPEFERTMATMVNLYLIIDGGDIAFNRFIESQPVEEALTRENFEKLHQYALATIKDHPDGLQAIEIDLLLGDMGKTPKARELAKAFSIEERDHDIFLGECLKKCPHIFPTFLNLSETLQKELKESTALVHFGHVSHLEGGPEILSKLKASGLVATNPKALDLQLLAYMLDVSGARAHETNRGAKTFTNRTFFTLNGMKDALYKLSEGTEKDAISHYVNFQCNLFGLESDKQEDCVLARIGSLMRFFTPEEGQAMKNAFQPLESTQKDIIIEAFDPFTIREERTSTYIPALLINFLNSATQQGLSREEAIQRCIKEGVTAIATFLKDYRNGQSNQPYSPSMTLNFNKAAGQVRDNFNIFSTHTFSIDQHWNAILVE